ncbi:MAG: TetR/AcrR family transcriptional regulator [Cytophagales bacterium]|nr:TetR/AcrR family transcriptional regulator [Cytophagales bacterium]MCA6389204.1 TetR/AcrR family transcriptional regulator [Cytophagales bacterium]MCA6390353.1 TetR/AcrR family transcriptional regulator [Cytophagales bacterium]MCA6394329.1 TetR/AcrR family transcriptional regulator [Cytophagales bacterium]MCA6399793.1 TetR/AcrR family transcriptional regulator [Cytophagales bacterium]
MSLRKEKAAILKLSVLDHTIKMIGTKSFDKIHVDEICKKTKISKVTLFKYFPQKEDLLLYYFRVWSLRRLVELKEKPREGLAGIQYLFDKISEDFEAHPGIILSWVGYLSDMGRTIKPFPLKAEEKKLLFPEVKDIQLIELQSLDQMIEKFSLEAIFKKEITKTTSTRDITNAFMAIFYGSIINAYINQVNPAKMFFRKNVETLLKGLS